MPPVALFIASVVATISAEATIAALAIGASTAVANAVFAVVTWATYAGIAYGASRILNKQPKLPAFIADASDRTQMIRQAAASRRIVYGKVKTSGPLIFAHSTGTNNEYLHLVILLATHEIEQIVDVYLNDELLTFSGTTGGAVTGKYAGYVRVNFKYGGTGQTADTDLVSETGGVWTSADKLGDIAYMYVRLKYDAKMFTSGLPNFSAIIKGRKVYDPRTGTTAYSNNAALCVYDYLTDTKFGLGVQSTEIDTATIQAAANVCDEAVSLAAGGTESRYTLNGTVDTAQSPQNVIEALLSSMSGRAIYAGGKWFIKAGAYSTPTVTLTESDLRGPIGVQTKLSRRELCNGVKGVFVSPDSLWQPTDFPPQIGTVAASALTVGLKYTIAVVGTSDFTLAGAASNAVGVTFTATGTTTGTGTADLYQGQDNGERLWKDVQLPYTTSNATAQRLARIDLERSRRQITVSLPCKLTALTVQAGDNIMLTNARLGWSAKVFEVTSFSFASYSDADGNPALGVDLVLRETDSNVWAWGGNDITLPSAATTTLPSPYTVAAPTGLSLAVSSFRQTDGNLVPQLQVSWTAPAEQTVQSGGLIRIQYKTHAAGNWTEWGTVKGDQVFDYITAALIIGTAYDVQIRSENVLGVPSAWVQSLNFTVTADTTPPTVRNDLAATVGTGKSVSLAWSLNTDADFAGQYNVYRGAGGGGSRSKIATVYSNRFVDVNVTLGSSYDYDVRGLDQTGNEATASNVVTATPSVVAFSSVDATAPTDPTASIAPTSNGTYKTTDGTIYSYVQFTLKGLPTGAVGQYLLFRRNGDSQWMISGDYTNTVDLTGVRINDLSPGVSYDFAVQAYSFSGTVTNIIAVTTGTNYTAPVKTTLPAAPTGITYTAGNSSTFNEQPPYSSNGLMLACKIEWNPSADSDVVAYEYVTSSVDTGAAATSALSPVGPGYVSTPLTNARKFIAKSDILVGSAYFRVRSVDSSGNRSAWFPADGAGTDINASLMQRPVVLGTTSTTSAAGNDTRITGAAQKASNLSDLASASTARSNLGFRSSVSHVQSVPGGSPTYVFSYTHNFGVLQDKVIVQVVAVSSGALDMTEYLVQHDYGNGGNTSNVAYFVICTKSGVNLTTQSVRMTINWLP